MSAPPSNDSVSRAAQQLAAVQTEFENWTGGSASASDLIAIAQVIATNELTAAVQGLRRPKKSVQSPISGHGSISALAEYVLPIRAAQATGLTVIAIKGKIAQGVWIEGREWVKGPDGRRYISMKGYEAWVERGRG